MVMLTLLMIQLQHFGRLVMVFLTAPLGLIGVVPALLAFNAPFGFVALLGVIALGGMIMRNALILVDQIEQDIAAGQAPWQAIIEATVRRARPVALTAAAAVLAMFPLTRSVFWGPMAISIMGGLIAATALTLLFVPALYAAWSRVRRPLADSAAAPADGAAALALPSGMASNSAVRGIFQRAFWKARLRALAPVQQVETGDVALYRAQAADSDASQRPPCPAQGAVHAKSRPFRLVPEQTLCHSDPDCATSRPPSNASV
jgi:predicted RND superfamily exporter protein